MARQILASRPAPGFERVYPPGHLEAEAEARARVEGIALNAVTLEALAAEARHLGLDPGTL